MKIALLNWRKSVKRRTPGYWEASCAALFQFFCRYLTWIRQSEVRIRILLSPSKNSKKTLDFYCFATSLGLLISEALKNDVNVPSKSNKQKKFSVGILKVTNEKSRIRIHQSEVRGSGFGSVPKCHRSETYVPVFLRLPILGRMGRVTKLICICNTLFRTVHK